MKMPVAIPVSKLHPFEGHPYKVLDNEEMNTLIESIQTQGILPKVNKSFLIHRRQLFQRKYG